MADTQAAALADDADRPQSLFDRVKAQVQADPKLRQELSDKAEAANKTIDTYIEDNADSLQARVKQSQADVARKPGPRVGIREGTAEQALEGPGEGLNQPAPKGPLGRLSESFQADTAGPITPEKEAFPGRPQGNGAPSSSERGPSGGLRAQPFTLPGSQSNAPEGSPTSTGPGGIPLASAGQAPATPSDRAQAEHPAAPAGAAGGAAGGPAGQPKAPKGGAGGASDTAAAPSTPDDLMSRIAAQQDALKKETGTVRTDVDKKLTALDNLAAQYQAAYKEGMSKAQWGEAAEKLGHAFAMIGAGQQGLKSGVDMSSGLKFDRTDWSSRYKDLLDELKVNLMDIRTRAGEAKEEGKERIGSAEKSAELGAKGAETQAQLEARERESKAQQKTQLEAARIGAASRENVAGTRAGATVESANIRAGATISSAQLRKAGGIDPNAKLNAKDEADLAGAQAYLNALASGDTKSIQANRKYEVAGNRLMPGKFDSLMKQARDNSGLFGSGEAPTAADTRAKPTTVGTGTQTAAAKVVSPEQLQAYMKAHSIDEIGARKFLISQGYQVQ